MEKRNIVISAIVVILIAIAFIIVKNYNNKNLEDYSEFDNQNISWLKVENGKIKNELNEVVLLKGISSHGINWYSDLLTEDAFKYLKRDFNINTFRVAIYINKDTNFEIIKQQLYPIVDNLVKLNLYVIIDWHILEDGDPNIYITQASEFFSQISKKYQDIPNIMYEICNEPNGNDITWDEKIKPYAEKIIPLIRKNSPKSIIIVGTPDYCKKVNKPADNPINYENIVYSVHFYAGIYGEYIKNNIEYAIGKGIAVLVTEWGTTDDTGDGKIYEELSKEWIEFLEEKNIGYINWSFCNKNEGSAILTEKYNNKKEKVIHKYLTDSGKLVQEIYK